MVRPLRFAGKSNLTSDQMRTYSRGRGSAIPSNSNSPTWPTQSTRDIPPPGLEQRFGFTTGFVPTDVAVSDFNHDGYVDFAVSSGWEDSLSLFFGRGGGEFDPPRIQLLKGVSPMSTEAVDLQGDGHDDLVLCQIDSRTVGVLAGKGDGTFHEEESYPVFARCGGTVSADFTGDGVVDIVVFYLDSYGETVWPDGFNIKDGLALLQGKGDGTFSNLQFERGPLWTSIDRLDAADFDGDSDLDLVGGGPNLGAVTYSNDGSGRFARDRSWLPSPPWNPLTSVAAGDLNNDRCEDAVATFYYGDVVRLMGDCRGDSSSEQQCIPGSSRTRTSWETLIGTGFPTWPSSDPAFPLPSAGVRAS